MTVTVERHDLTDACPTCFTRDQEPTGDLPPADGRNGTASYECEACSQVWHTGGLEPSRFA